MKLKTQYAEEPFIRLIQPKNRTEQQKNIDFIIEFSFPKNFLEDITLDNIKEAYRKMDRRIKVRYRVALYRKGSLLNRKLAEVSFSKKWILYWTRDPMITERYQTNIWVLGVDKNLEAEFFADFDEAKTFLFSFREELSVPPELLRESRPAAFAEVEVRSHKHYFLDELKFRARSKPVQFF